MYWPVASNSSDILVLANANNEKHSTLLTSRSNTAVKVHFRQNGSRLSVGRGMFFHATLARSFIQSLHLRGDDDFVDRLNYYYTPIMLAVACVIISAKQVLFRCFQTDKHLC